MMLRWKQKLVVARLNLKQIIVFLPIIALSIASGCGQSGDANKNKPKTQKISTSLNSQSPPANIPINSGGSSGNQSSCGRTAGISGPVYKYFLQGVGNSSVETTNLSDGQIRDLDHTLRVKVIPYSAGKSSTSGGQQQYSQMGFDLTLLKNGSPDRTYHIPANDQDSSGSKIGLKVGSAYSLDLSDRVFSNDVSYSFRVSNVMTDAKCNTFCSTRNTVYTACYAVDYWTCSSWAAYGYYAVGWYGCCGPDYNMINQCRAQQCNIGPVNSTATWSLEIQAETDATECL